MKRIILLLFTSCILSIFVNAQDKIISDTCVKIGWGWGCTISQNIANPNKTAGVGNSAATVAKIAFTGGSWSGQFGITNFPTNIDWSKYGKIELLVYPEIASNFVAKVDYKGWKNKSISAHAAKAIDSTKLTAKTWQIVTLDLTKTIVNDTNTSIIYKSLSDTNLNANTIMLTFQLTAAEGTIYIAGITLKEPVVVPTTTKDSILIPVSAVRNGWGWNSAFTYGVSNPNKTAGVGCSATSVTKVALSKSVGSFGIVDTTNIFSWSSITDWSKYNQIELLVYAEDTCTFLDSISYKGWDSKNSANVSVNVGNVISPQKLIANKWQKVIIDLTKTLKSGTTTYSTLTDLGLNTLQFTRLNLNKTNVNVYIGAITLKKGSLPAKVLDTVVIPLQAVRNGWGWNNTLNYNVSTPDATAGLGCLAPTVTQVGISGWAGSFGISDTTTLFSWANITDWSKYNCIEMLVYPDIAETFIDTISFKGWDNALSANVASTVGTVYHPSSLTANVWQKVAIDITKPIVCNLKTYASYSDFGLNNLQLQALQLTAETGNLYIGSIKLLYDTTSFTSSKIVSLHSKVKLSPNPASSFITVTKNGNDQAKISVKTITGTEVIATTSNNVETKIDVSSLSAGIYVISIITPQGIQSEKLIVR